jgi:hypothetical protein
MSVRATSAEWSAAAMLDGRFTFPGRRLSRDRSEHSLKLGHYWHTAD